MPIPGCPRCQHKGPLVADPLRWPQPHCSRCGWYDVPLSDDRALLEAVSAAYQQAAPNPPERTLLELLDAGVYDLIAFWAAAVEVCLCWSCGGQCGGSGVPGWCGPVQLAAGRLLCDVCRAQ